MTFAEEWTGCLHLDVSARMATHPQEFARLDDNHIAAAVILMLSRRNLTCTDDDFRNIVQAIKPALVADRAWQRRIEANPRLLTRIHRRR